MYITKKHNDFTVYSLKDQNSFMHLNLADSQSFYRDLFNYFFEESRLLRYVENKTNLHFEPTAKNYVTLFKHLGLYIDDFNIQQLPASIEEEVLRILSDEYELENAGDGQLKVRLDKMGKIGEYIFCNLLSEYFGLECIIPKVHLTTDSNMNVYGIDTLFYSSEKDMILFGESKLSKSLSNGTRLINKSLQTYENQIRDEFNLMLSNRFMKNNLGLFGDKYADLIELSLSIEDFIEKADVKRIGVPIFIAHGTCITPDDIFDKLSNIEKTTLLGLETIYIVISLPIFNKSKMISLFTHGIAERRGHYEYEARK